MATTNRRTAYSYIRFSTPEQSLGDSHRRQIEAAKVYAERSNLDLAEDVYFDEGVSGFKGLNAAEGNLRRFITAVERGTVPRGSILIVESIDRLSRERLTMARRLIEDILSLDIDIVTLSPERTYTKASLDNLLEMIEFLVIASRANEESLTKQRRVREVWATKRNLAAQNGKPLTAKVPGWLQVPKLTPETRDAPREIEVLEDHAKVVCRIFEMALDGNGKQIIAARLNSEGVPTFTSRSNGWHASYVQKILTSEAVIGRFQPHRYTRDPDTGKTTRVPDGDPIEDYYPTVIPVETFQRVRHLRQSGTKGFTGAGRKGKWFSNLFSRLALCGNCGGTMHSMFRGQKPWRYQYLQCGASKRKLEGHCGSPPINYSVVERNLLACLDPEGDLNLRGILGSLPSPANSDGTSGTAREPKGRPQQLREAIEATRGKLGDANKAVQNFFEVIAMLPAGVAKQDAAAQMAKLSSDREGLEGELERLEGELQEVLSSGGSDNSRTGLLDDTWELVQQWNSAIKELEQGGADTRSSGMYDVNIKINAALKRLFEEVYVARGDSALEWIEGEFFDFLKQRKYRPFPDDDVIAVEEHYADVVGKARAASGGGGVSISCVFANSAEGSQRQLIIYCDPKVAGRYVAVVWHQWKDPEDDEPGVSWSAEMTVSALPKVVRKRSAATK